MFPNISSTLFSLHSQKLINFKLPLCFLTKSRSFVRILRRTIRRSPAHCKTSWNVISLEITFWCPAGRSFSKLWTTSNRLKTDRHTIHLRLKDQRPVGVSKLWEKKGKHVQKYKDVWSVVTLARYGRAPLVEWSADRIRFNSARPVDRVEAKRNRRIYSVVGRGLGEFRRRPFPKCFRASVRRLFNWIVGHSRNLWPNVLHDRLQTIRPCDFNSIFDMAA